MITQDKLKELVNYNPQTGEFTWKKREGNTRFNTRFEGKKVGSLCPKGYLTCRMLGKSVRLHVLAWIYMTGEKPKYVDHKNRIKSDNKFENLRSCTANQNQWNSGIKPNNKSGFKGVRWNKQCKKWQAVVKCNYKSHHAGLFDCPKDAAKAYDKKCIDLHGDYAKTNKMMGLL